MSKMIYKALYSLSTSAGDIAAGDGITPKKHAKLFTRGKPTGELETLVKKYKAVTAIPVDDGEDNASDDDSASDDGASGD